MDFGRIILKGLKDNKEQYVKYKYKDKLNGKYKVVSLGIKIDKKTFNNNNNWGKWVNSKHPDHIKLNNQIAKFIVDKGYNIEITNKQGFIYLTNNTLIKHITNIGTQRNYTSALNTFKDFLIEKYNIEDIEINKINRELILNYKNYLFSSTSKTTAKIKLNILKTFISGLQKNDTNIIVNTKGIKIKTSEIYKKYLTEKQLLQLNYKPLGITNRKIDLDIVRNMFLLQVYANGIRVSDLMEIKFSNFIINDKKNIFIQKHDKKTGKPNSYILSDFTLSLLGKQINKLFDNNVYIIDNESGIFSNEKLSDLIKQLNNIKKHYQQAQANKQDTTEFKDLIKKTNKAIAKQIKTAIYIIIKNKEFQNKYVFSNYFNPDNNTDLEILLAHNRARASYRRHLIKLSKIMGFEKFTPHTARYTTANILIKNGVDIFTIKKLLNHKNIITTQNYISSFSKQYNEDNLIIENILNIDF